MRVTLTARHVEVPELFRELLMSKLEKLEHFGHEILGLHAIFGRERYFYTAELTLTTKGLTLVGKAKDQRDLLTCMEEALMKLKEQLRRHESKQVENRRRNGPHRP
ncbi:MAG: ribosome-associated translation inhibitor RaiA [Candidatus Omnitrophica bacterium]|nr:ribosome-associated translation inhibitor RaiA [Candidatus Omnitrophota bacterium]